MALHAPAAARRDQTIRVGWGAVLLAGASRGARAIGGPHTERVAAVLRLLGVRHVVQGAVLAARPTPELLRLGATADLLHAASMLGLAAADRPRRRPALLDALLALGWCGLTARDAGRHQRRIGA